MNALPKLVASTTLASADWNATVVAEDLPARLTELKQEPGKDLLILASAELFASLRPTGLVGKYRIRLVPALAGHGHHVFVRLLESRTFSSGIIVLTYVPDPSLSAAAFEGGS